MDVINVMEKFSLFQDQWSPKVIADLNGQQVKLAKIKGEFVWHDHKDEDELFYILKGKLKMQFRDGVKLIKEGEIIVVPKGVEHKPIAEEEVWVMLFEPAATKHTGDVETDMTVKNYERI
ncbi:MAG: cupin domain-containing protein [Saprospiraceae bacterium]|nr:cupin domain-containing protein [Saprospiraceae bacterium]